jgi:hypothetical protein
VLLDLMEKYDLTYKIPEDDEHRSLVVERLPKEPVAPPDEWEALKPSAAGGVREMQMTLELQSMQAGIPSWFIARKHYHTLRRHWLHGVYFADDRKAPRHVALVRTPPDQQPPRVELTVRGPFPQTFFAVMKDGLEASIRDRYPELIKAQKIPCCCQDGKPGAEPCPHLFNYERLLERLAKGKKSAECDVSQEDVSVAELLFGYDDPGGSLEKQLREATDEILAKLDDVAADVRQNFRLLYDDLQQREESACPNLFVIWKAERGKPFHVPMRMALLCQHPGEEHINCKPEEAYHIDALKDYLRKAAPLLKGVATVLRYAKLTGLPFAREWHEEIQDAVDNVQDTLKEMLEDFEEVAEKGEAPELLAPEIDGRLGANRQKRVAGAALREFRALLDKVDETRRWHGLVKRKWNQTGEYLWVCERHAAQADYK